MKALSKWEKAYSLDLEARGMDCSASVGISAEALLQAFFQPRGISPGGQPLSPESYTFHLPSPQYTARRGELHSSTVAPNNLISSSSRDADLAQRLNERPGTSLRTCTDLGDRSLPLKQCEIKSETFNHLFYLAILSHR